MSYGLGKFDSAVDEVIFTVAFDSMWNDDHQGESDAPTGYFGMMAITREDAAAILADDVVRSMIAPEDMPVPGDIVGHWLVTENSQGFVSVADMGDLSAMREAYRALARAYDDYLMCQQCLACGVLLNECGEDADGGRCCEGTDDRHVPIERDAS